MDCHIQLENRVPRSDPAYAQSGNVLLDRLLGATLHDFPEGENEAGADAGLEAIAETLRKEGRSPYVIHLGPGHPPLGALGYVDAAAEILVQLAERDLAIGRIVVASGSGYTHAGLLAGLRTFGSPIPVTGVCVRRDAAAQRVRIRARAEEICRLLGLDPAVGEDDIVLDETCLAPGYGQLNDRALEALSLAARTEGLFLDPVYTAKALAGLIGHVREYPAEGPLLFIHTGGTPALFGYEPALAPILIEREA
jgi:1-aminocyclopropane-1-carboxylate deaminase/D-cysteine desulfhydrase-like pyridoxal-dependent ACC family enzyme